MSRSLLFLLVVLLCGVVLCRGQMDMPMYAEEEEYEVYAVVDADDFDIQQFGFGGAGFGAVGGAGKGLGALPTVVQCSGKHGCLGGRGGHGKGGGALNIIVGVPTPVPTPVPVPVYQPMQTVGRVHYEPQTYQTKQQVQVPVTTKQQFHGQAYVPQTYGKAQGYGGY